MTSKCGRNKTVANEPPAILVTGVVIYNLKDARQNGIRFVL